MIEIVTGIPHVKPLSVLLLYLSFFICLTFSFLILSGIYVCLYLSNEKRYKIPKVINVGTVGTYIPVFVQTISFKSVGLKWNLLINMKQHVYLAKPLFPHFSSCSRCNIKYLNSLNFQLIKENNVIFNTFHTVFHIQWNNFKFRCNRIV